MSKDLVQIHNKLNKTIQTNFSKALSISAIIESVDHEKNYFTIKTQQNGENVIECHTKNNMEKLIIGDIVKIKGWIQLHPQNASKIFLNVEHFYIADKKYKYDAAINLYNKLHGALLLEKYQQTINKKFALIKPPVNIMNVGLIVVPDTNDKNIENFKIAFQEKCLGKLFIYRLQNDQITEVSLRTAFEYLKKYHFINIIILLIGHTTIENICELSSKNNVKYLLYRKKCPYVVSITSTTTNDLLDDKSMEPLSTLLSNKKFSGINNCMDFIHNIQSIYRNTITNGIQLGDKFLLQILNTYKRDLCELKLLASELADVRFLPKTTKLINPINNSLLFEKLKIMLSNRLIKEQLNLYNIQMTNIKKIIEDPGCQRIFRHVIEAERKIELETIAASPQDNRSVNVINELDSVKKNTSSKQNQYTQEHSDQLEETMHSIDNT